MRCVWDIQKSDANVARRGFDFAFAAQIFDREVFERDDLRRDYGERRIVAVGIADGVYVTVVYTDRKSAYGQVRRIISARPCNRRERQDYEKALASKGYPRLR